MYQPATGIGSPSERVPYAVNAAPNTTTGSMKMRAPGGKDA